MTEATRVDGTRQSEANEPAEVRPARQAGAVLSAEPPPGGSGVGEGPEKMGCGASAPSPPVGTPTPRITSGPTKGAQMMDRAASAQTQVGEHTTKQGQQQQSHETDSAVRRELDQGQMDTKAAGMHSIDQQMKCEKHTEEEILEEKLGKLFEALRQPDYPKLRKSHLVDPASSQAGIINEEKKAVLADGLVALGISRRADAFIDDLFDGNIKELAESEFKDKVKEERQISLRFLFLPNLTPKLQNLHNLDPRP